MMVGIAFRRPPPCDLWEQAIIIAGYIKKKKKNKINKIKINGCGAGM